MSFDAIKWAIAQKVEKSSAKFVLVAMADCVNADGGADMVCWPSYKHLTERTCQDVKTVEAGLRRLREAGFIADTGERKGGTGQVIVYRLKTPENGALTPLPKIAYQAPELTAQPALVAPSKTTDEPKTPKSGVVDTAGKTPVFPGKTPEFPFEDPQISHETPPKTGDGTSNGTTKGSRNGTSEEARATLIPGVSSGLLADWQVVRKAKRAGPLTPTAVAGLVREATKAGLTCEEAVTACCEFGWQGFNAGWYAERVAKGQIKPAPGKHAGFQQLDYSKGVNPDGSFT